eukprot:268782-Prorocentrum_minimum.AAC.1
MGEAPVLRSSLSSPRRALRHLRIWTPGNTACIPSSVNRWLSGFTYRTSSAVSVDSDFIPSSVNRPHNPKSRIVKLTSVDSASTTPSVIDSRYPLCTESRNDTSSLVKLVKEATAFSTTSGRVPGVSTSSSFKESVRRVARVVIAFRSLAFAHVQFK